MGMLANMLPSRRTQPLSVDACAHVVKQPPPSGVTTHSLFSMCWIWVYPWLSIFYPCYASSYCRTIFSIPWYILLLSNGHRQLIRITIRLSTLNSWKEGVARRAVLGAKTVFKMILTPRLAAKSNVDRTQGREQTRGTGLVYLLFSRKSTVNQKVCLCHAKLW